MSSQFNYLYGDQIHFPYSIASLAAYIKSKPDLSSNFIFEKTFISWTLSGFRGWSGNGDTAGRSEPGNRAHTFRMTLVSKDKLPQITLCRGVTPHPNFLRACVHYAWAGFHRKPRQITSDWLPYQTSTNYARAGFHIKPRQITSDPCYFLPPNFIF